ncbi:hypothetical protein WA026_006226 [Henosepilachna vigintioctopunctata]|uniref:Uncharacterized protein n=1 Tax=Henosepilachna vigintioctopunctata TaxID=420089 RepID=A0AAW1TSL0_9CUCU
MRWLYLRAYDDPSVETPVVEIEIDSDIYSYRNAVTAAPKLHSIDKIDPKSSANENHDTIERKPYKHPTVICTGSKEGNPTFQVKGVVKRKWVYVCGQNLWTRSNRNRHERIFDRFDSVVVPSDALFELLLKPESWPNGVVLREFNFKNFFRAGKRKSDE